MTKPFPYQRQAVRDISWFDGRALLALEMGLGKTIISLVWARLHRAFPMVVVCPASLKLTWQEEAERHVNLESTVLDGRKSMSSKILPISRPRLVIVNYEILGAWRRYLKALQPKLVVIDETQRIKNRDAKCTKHTRWLCRGVPYVLGLSGTPLINRPAELFTILRLLYPSEFDSWYEYGQRYCGAKLTRFGWDYRGASRLNELHRRLLELCMIRQRKSEVLDQLPAKHRCVISLPITNRGEYIEAAHNFLSWLSRISPERAKRAARAQQLAKMGYLKRLAGILKLPATIGWIRSFLEDSDQKLVVFAVHRKVIRTLYDEFKGVSVVLDGTTPMRDRRRAIKRFQHDSRCRLFIGNIQAAGVGLTLTAASTVAFAELGWTPGEHIQAEDRTHRIGQEKKVLCYYLVANDTIESMLCQLIQRKQEILDSTLDGRPGVTDLDIFTQLTNMIRRRFNAI